MLTGFSRLFVIPAVVGSVIAPAVYGCRKQSSPIPESPILEAWDEANSPTLMGVKSTDFGGMAREGFLPEERAWMTTLLNDGGMVDVYRQLHPDTTDACYTWWSNRGQAYTNNVGWRLDYHLATPALAETARSVAVYKDEKFSDHAPVTITYDMSL